MEINDAKYVIFRDVRLGEVIAALKQQGINLDVEYVEVGVGALMRTDTIKVMLFEKLNRKGPK